MKNYAKVIWHVYPFLKAVVKDYEEHIRNKAVLSFDSRTTAERLAEYIAGEIIVKERLQALKGKLDEVVDKLDDTEKKLLAMRYARLRLRFARYDIVGGCVARYDAIKGMLNADLWKGFLIYIFLPYLFPFHYYFLLF